MSTLRIGIGYDVHRLVEGRRLILGGVDIPYEKGLLGHSDGDVLIHAICDAILGAISEGDIGFHFPDNDESIRGIESRKILARVMELVRTKQYRLVNVDAVVAAMGPRVAPYKQAMRNTLAGLMGISPENVGVKGKTTEGLGFVGRSEGIEVYAVALVEKAEPGAC